MNPNRVRKQETGRKNFKNSAAKQELCGFYDDCYFGMT